MARAMGLHPRTRDMADSDSDSVCRWEKCDERRFDQCLDRVGDLEVDTPWVKSDKGRVPMGVIFGIDGGLAQSLNEHSNDLPKGDADHDHNPSYDHEKGHQSEVEVLSIELSGPKGSSVNAEKLQKLLKAAPKDEVYRIKAVLTTSTTVKGSDDDMPTTTPTQAQSRYILNWAFGRWTFTSVPDEVSEHESSHHKILRMTLILARYESTKWKKKLETGGFLELDGENTGELVVNKIA